MVDTAAPPGTEAPRRFRPRLRYELLGCGLHGHELLGTDAARVGPDDALYVRQDGHFRWYRCLRCDSWLPLADPDPAAVTVDHPPARRELAVPFRGRPLRDRFVLRAIALERVLHAVVLGALTVLVFLFALHRSALHHEYTRILTDLQGGLGGPVVSSRSGVVNDLNRLFALPAWELYTAGALLSLYTVLLVAEIVGLWRARRWAEYLTFVETGVLVPYEVYELIGGVTALKVITFLLNLAILVYLLVVHRLFGVRGGGRAERALHRRDTGWEAIERATPAWLTTTGPAPSTDGPGRVTGPGPARGPDRPLQ